MFGCYQSTFLHFKLTSLSVNVESAVEPNAGRLSLRFEPSGTMKRSHGGFINEKLLQAFPYKLASLAHMLLVGAWVHFERPSDSSISKSFTRVHVSM